MRPTRVPPLDSDRDQSFDWSAEDRDIDSALSSLFEADRADIDASTSAANVELIARVLDATVDDVRPVVESGTFRIADYRRTIRAVAGGLAAAVVGLAVLPLFWASEPEDGPRLAMVGGLAEGRPMPVDLEVFGGPRESEVMLAAVLDPQDDWLSDLSPESGPGLDVGTILESRSFDIVDLEDDVVAMLRHSTS